MITSLSFVRLSPYNDYLLFIYANERSSPFITYHMWNSNHHESNQRVIQRFFTSIFSLIEKNALQGISLRTSPHREDIIHKGLHLKISPFEHRSWEVRSSSYFLKKICYPRMPIKLTLIQLSNFLVIIHHFVYIGVGPSHHVWIRSHPDVFLDSL